jgi:hypothetical protein
MSSLHIIIAFFVHTQRHHKLFFYVFISKSFSTETYFVLSTICYHLKVVKIKISNKNNVFIIFVTDVSYESAPTI